MPRCPYTGLVLTREWTASVYQARTNPRRHITYSILPPLLAALLDRSKIFTTGKYRCISSQTHLTSLRTSPFASASDFMSSHLLLHHFRDLLRNGNFTCTYTRSIIMAASLLLDSWPLTCTIYHDHNHGISSAILRSLSMPSNFIYAKQLHLCQAFSSMPSNLIYASDLHLW